MTLEIVKTIKDRLTRAAKDGELPGRIILAGGTAIVFGIPFHLNFPSQFNGCSVLQYVAVYFPSQFNGSLFNESWQERPRERDP